MADTDDHRGDDHRGGCGGFGPGFPDCEDAIRRLYHFLDGELTEIRRIQISHHLSECSPCLGAFDFEKELRIVIARKCRDTVPPALRERVRRALEASGMPPSGEYDWE